MEPTSQVNLTMLAREIQRSLDDFQAGPPERTGQRHEWDDGGFRIVWHARLRRDDEQAEPVIVT